MYQKLKPFEGFPSYSFKDPDTAYEHKGKSFKELINSIIHYRVQNSLPPIDMLEETIENYLCGKPENAQRCMPVKFGRSIGTSVKGGVVLFINYLFNRFVSQKVADERGAQCLGCVFNKPDVGAPIDHLTAWMDNVALMQVGEKRSVHHDKLFKCQVCDCPLRSKVFQGSRLPLFPDDQVEKMKSVNCWQLKLSRQG